MADLTLVKSTDVLITPQVNALAGGKLITENSLRNILKKINIGSFVVSGLTVEATSEANKYKINKGICCINGYYVNLKEDQVVTLSGAGSIYINLIPYSDGEEPVTDDDVLKGDMETVGVYYNRGIQIANDVPSRHLGSLRLATISVSEQGLISVENNKEVSPFKYIYVELGSDNNLNYYFGKENETATVYNTTLNSTVFNALSKILIGGTVSIDTSKATLGTVISSYTLEVNGAGSFTKSLSVGEGLTVNGGITLGTDLYVGDGANNGTVYLNNIKSRAYNSNKNIVKTTYDEGTVSKLEFGDSTVQDVYLQGKNLKLIMEENDPARTSIGYMSSVEETFKELLGIYIEDEGKGTIEASGKVIGMDLIQSGSKMAQSSGIHSYGPVHIFDKSLVINEGNIYNPKFTIHKNGYITSTKLTVDGEQTTIQNNAINLKGNVNINLDNNYGISITDSDENRILQAQAGNNHISVCGIKHSTYHAWLLQAQMLGSEVNLLYGDSGYNTKFRSKSLFTFDNDIDVNGRVASSDYIYGKGLKEAGPDNFNLLDYTMIDDKKTIIIGEDRIDDIQLLAGKTHIYGDLVFDGGSISLNNNIIKAKGMRTDDGQNLISLSNGKIIIGSSSRPMELYSSELFKFNNGIIIGSIKIDNNVIEGVVNLKTERIQFRNGEDLLNYDDGVKKLWLGNMDLISTIIPKGDLELTNGDITAKNCELSSSLKVNGIEGVKTNKISSIYNIPLLVYTQSETKHYLDIGESGDNEFTALNLHARRTYINHIVSNGNIEANNIQARNYVTAKNIKTTDGSITSDRDIFASNGTVWSKRYRLPDGQELLGTCYREVDAEREDDDSRQITIKTIYNDFVKPYMKQLNADNPGVVKAGATYTASIQYLPSNKAHEVRYTATMGSELTVTETACDPINDKNIWIYKIIDTGTDVSVNLVKSL